MIYTIVGGGSTFTPGIVKSIALRKEELDVEEIRLFDLDRERQDKVAVVVRWILHEELNSGIPLTVTYDEESAYRDADFIFAQMRVGKYALGRWMRRSRCVTAVWDRRPAAAVVWPTGCGPFSP